MRILGIDSSSLVASVSLLEDGIILGEYTINHKITHSQTLLPMIEQLLNMIDVDINTVDAVAIAAGPGSFTGLRIGGSTAKGLGQALSVPIIPVPTIDAMAYNLYMSEAYICPIMDARRNQVYAGVFTFDNEHFKVILEQEPMEIDEFLRRIEDLCKKDAKNVIFLGDGVPVFTRYINEKLNVPHFYAPAHLNRQRAAAVATLGAKYYEDGKYVKAEEFVPIYLRQSQAEMAKEGQRI